MATAGGGANGAGTGGDAGGDDPAAHDGSVKAEGEPHEDEPLRMMLVLALRPLQRYKSRFMRVAPDYPLLVALPTVKVGTPMPSFAASVRPRAEPRHAVPRQPCHVTPRHATRHTTPL